MPRSSRFPTLLTASVLLIGSGCDYRTAPDRLVFALDIVVEGGGEVQYVNPQGDLSRCGAAGNPDVSHDCTVQYSAAAAVTIQRTTGLSDLNEASTRLAGWGGACAGLDADAEPRGGACQVVMNGHRSVTVTFEDRVLARIAHFLGSMIQVRWDLDYAPRAQKGGANPLARSGVFDCSWSATSPACKLEAWFDRGTVLTVNVDYAGNGAAFDEWGGECSGEEHACAVTLAKDVNSIVVFWGFAPGVGGVEAPAGAIRGRGPRLR